MSSPPDSDDDPGYWLEIDIRGGYDGVPGNRDPQAVCSGYMVPYPRADCNGDGHYLCLECPNLNERGRSRYEEG